MSAPLPLFDANGCFGKPATGGSDFPTIAARLAHMDRLGISRALVWNTEAQQHNATASNRKLLDEIASTPGASGRIVPSLVISPLMLYERDGVAALRRQMDEGRTRSLRLANVFGRVTLMQCEPVIRELRDRKPFIAVSMRATTAPDVLAFTETFPDIPLIITSAMWPDGISVLDLMRHRPNILLEISWWHTWDGVGLVARQFGAKRVLFGTGSRSHAGAAIAALARAGLDKDELARIAHGTLDHLTGLTTTPLGAPGLGKLWQRFVDGKPLGVEIVDAHGHLGPSGGYVLEHQTEAAQVPVALRAMDELGQSTMVMSGLEALLGDAVKGNEMLEDILRPHAGRFLGYVSFNPFYADDLMARLDRWFAGNFFVGFKLLCSYWGTPVTDARFKPMWEYANARRLPILLHTWDGGMDSPAMLRDIVRQYPDAAFLIGHSGGGNKGRAEAETLAAENRNVYLEWCGSFCSTTMWEDTLKRVSPSQVVYGTDAMAHGVDWELGRLLSADIPDKTITPILGANLRRILSQRRKA